MQIKKAEGKMRAEFKEFVGKAGQALEMEDRYFLGAMQANKQAYPKGNGGILNINNERYYQFVIARALKSSFRYQVSIEKDSHDFVLEDPISTGSRFAVIELKRWMSSGGKKEIAWIIDDIKLK